MDFVTILIIVAAVATIVVLRARRGALPFRLSSMLEDYQRQRLRGHLDWSETATRNRRLKRQKRRLL